MRRGEAWPIYDLVLRSGTLELRLPTEDELLELLELSLAGIHDPAEMPFGLAWTDQPRPQRERSSMQYWWSTRANWKPEEWVIDFGVWSDGVLVGTQGVRGDNFPVMKTIGTGSWLGRAYQGKGIGKAMRSAVLSFAFDHLGAERATSSAFLDNVTSSGVSRSLGYVDDGSEWLAPRGVPRQMTRFLMNRDAWHSRERPPISVEGLEACRELFGI